MAAPASRRGGCAARTSRGQRHPVLPGQRLPPSSSDTSVPHAAPPHTATVTTARPPALPAPRGPSPMQGTAGGVPGSSVGKPRTDPGPLQRGPVLPPQGHPSATPGLPPFTPAPPAPQKHQLFPFPRGHPQCLWTRVLGGIQQHKWLSACWGDREQGARPWCPTARPRLAAARREGTARGQDGAPCAQGRHCPGSSL